ncbi:unnamed protein product [Adineta ricciae]|uniref:G-protein coupled receptors family 1 profile domain-containing protein n=1 Tax=Adineta ricciae TaxID=249248 RepID=A0A815HIM1_ADIRI|nr:unnamed protein product [Adineta ricciae]
MQSIDSRRFISSDFCLFIYYTYGTASIQMPFAFVTFTIHRFCSILYHNRPFFRTNKWVIICIAGQWIIQFIVSLPFIFRSGHPCLIPPWVLIYLCGWVVVIPSFVNIALNIRIFMYVRSSSRRVQPTHHITTITNLNNTQQQQQHPPSWLGRREIFLLRHMIYMFIMFIGGWGPLYFFLFISQLTPIQRIARESAVLLCELSLLTLIINLFICNQELRQHLFNKLRCNFCS